MQSADGSRISSQVFCEAGIAMIASRLGVAGQGAFRPQLGDPRTPPSSFPEDRSHSLVISPPLAVGDLFGKGSMGAWRAELHA